MPLPRFWYLPRGEKAVVRDERRRPLAEPGSGRHGQQLRPLQGPQPRRLLGRQLGVRALDVLHLSRARRSPTRRRRATTPTASSSRVHPLVVLVPDDRDHRSGARRVLRHPARPVPGQVHERPAQVSSRTHCVYWPDWASNAKVELARGIRMDANYYHYPGPWIGAKPGFMTGGGFPMRFADLDGTPIDVYQQNTNMTDESTTRLPGDRSTRCSTTPSAPRATTAPSARTCTRTRRRRMPGAEAIVASAQARSVPVISYKQLLDLGRRPQQLDHPRPRLERRHAHVRHDRRRRGQRPPDDAAGAGPGRNPDRDHPGRRARHLHRADDQGHPVRVLHGGYGDLPGHLLTRTPAGRLGRPWPPVRCPHGTADNVGTGE